MKAVAYLEDQYANPLWDFAAIGRAFKNAGVRVDAAHANQLERRLARVIKRSGLGRNVFHRARKAHIVALSWASDTVLFPKGLFSQIIPWIYDCWPPQYEAWVALLRRWKIRIAFFSSKTSALFFAERRPHTRCYWMAEAADVLNYDPRRELGDRQIDLLEYGRHFRSLYDAVAPILDGRQRNHYFLRDRTVTHKTLVPMIGDSKLVVCYPKSITEPASAGLNETVTQRYFEAMASRAVPIGYCPAELKELFGYNPVLELDLSRAGEQVEAILSNIETYQELADRNLQRLREVGSWDVRVRQMLAILGQHGYAVPPARSSAAA